MGAQYSVHLDMSIKPCVMSVWEVYMSHSFPKQMRDSLGRCMAACVTVDTEKAVGFLWGGVGEVSVRMMCVELMRHNVSGCVDDLEEPE